MSETDYIRLNQESWNRRTEVHLTSAFYDMEGFRRGQSSLNEPELNLLGDLRGKSVLHLQCHFGQDTLSLARLGAEVTGVDLADKAIENARAIAAELSIPSTFICSDIYELPQHLDRPFDVVFTSYGTIGWLPDLGKWAAVVARFLKPGGQFVMVDFHPVVWMFDNDFKEVGYRYFKSEAIIETEMGTYADPNAPVEVTSVSWNHSLSEILNSLIQHGLEIRSFDEFDYSPYNCFRETVEVAPKMFRIRHLGDKIPMMYAIDAVKKANA